ncbi:TIGR03915 family putative DNA repair protein [Clostridium sp. Mt-5]|uniref:TIGR03915 family putative DNA repair protein n=1 Tax=Clostridium moutaii TaxID=3240932 RepID=A0ABV4BNZ7_9CLOT
MPGKSNLIYKYDGSFDGLMCCVFESYYKREIPMDIISPVQLQTTFFPLKEIKTDLRKSSRVIDSIPKKISISALDFVRHAFLTCMPQKELYIFLFLRRGYHYGPPVMEMLADDVVSSLFKAVKYLKNESHLIKGFLRFSVFKGGLVAQIEPKNYVLPLITQHFCERYPEEYFLIYDKNHDMALVYNTHEPAIIPAEDLQVPEPDAREKYYRKLWKLFYNTVEIKERRNLKCRMGNMPKRYWKYMTEFASYQ